MDAPSPNYLGDWVIALAFIANLVVLLLTAWRLTRTQRAEVEIVAGVARKEDVEQLRRDLDQHIAEDKLAFGELKTALEVQRLERLKNVEELFVGQRQLMADVAETRKQAELTYQHVQRIESRLNRLTDKG